MDTADVVWNRACQVESGGTGVGDRQLWSLLHVHGCAMTGGVGFAADVCTPEHFAVAPEAGPLPRPAGACAGDRGNRRLDVGG